MKDLLIQTLEPLGYPIRQQGSFKKFEPYPDSFFTFWNNSADGAQYYDNADNATVWDFDLNFYSNDPALVNGTLLEAKKLLRTQGFIVAGAGYDVASDEETHTGRGINVLYLER